MPLWAYIDRPCDFGKPLRADRFIFGIPIVGCLRQSNLFKYLNRRRPLPKIEEEMNPSELFKTARPCFRQKAKPTNVDNARKLWNDAPGQPRMGWPDAHENSIIWGVLPIIRTGRRIFVFDPRYPSVVKYGKSMILSKLELIDTFVLLFLFPPNFFWAGGANR